MKEHKVTVHSWIRYTNSERVDYTIGCTCGRIFKINTMEMGHNQAIGIAEKAHQDELNRNVASNIRDLPEPV